MITIIAMVPDCFVAPILKDHHGHGEAKFYIGNREEYRDILCQKRISIKYSNEYVEYIKSSRHNTHILQNIKRLGEANFNLIPRVKQDLRRMYVGTESLRDKNWTLFRNTLLPSKSCIYFEEADNHIDAIIKPAYEFKSSNPIGYSKTSIDWLSYVEKKDNVEIQHALKGGEFSIKTKRGYKWPVDGFCRDNLTVYEFQGDYWHGNPAKYSPTHIINGKECSEIWKRDAIKKQAFEDAGYKFISIWEADWYKIKRELD